MGIVASWVFHWEAWNLQEQSELLVTACARWWSNLKNWSKWSEFKIDRKLINYFLQWMWLCSISKGSGKTTSVLLLKGNVSFSWLFLWSGTSMRVLLLPFSSRTGRGRNEVRFCKQQALMETAQGSIWVGLLLFLVSHSLFLYVVLCLLSSVAGRRH